MNKYTFICEKYDEYKESDDERIIIDVIANSEMEANEKISSFQVSRGQLHYGRIINCEYNVSLNTPCRKVKNLNDDGTIKLFVACFGAAISTVQMYAPCNDVYKKALKNDITLKLLRQ